MALFERSCSSSFSSERPTVPWRVVVKSERVPLFIEEIYEEQTIGKQYGLRLAEGSPREDCRRRRRNRRRKPRHTPVGLFIVTRTYGDRFRN